jgi:hypothetical protein
MYHMLLFGLLLAHLQEMPIKIRQCKKVALCDIAMSPLAAGFVCLEGSAVVPNTIYFAFQ